MESADTASALRSSRATRVRDDEPFRSRTELGQLGFCCLQGRQIRIRIIPDREKGGVLAAGIVDLALHGIGPGETEMRERDVG